MVMMDIDSWDDLAHKGNIFQHYSVSTPSMDDFVFTWGRILITPFWIQLISTSPTKHPIVMIESSGYQF